MILRFPKLGMAAMVVVSLLWGGQTVAEDIPSKNMPQIFNGPDPIFSRMFPEAKTGRDKSEMVERTSDFKAAPRLQLYFESLAFKRPISAALKADHSAAVNEYCPPYWRLTEPMPLDVYRPVVLTAGAVRPESGALHLQYTLDRCDARVRVNVFVSFSPEAPPSIRVIPPGKGVAALLPSSALHEAIVQKRNRLLGSKLHKRLCPDLRLHSVVIQGAGFSRGDGAISDFDPARHSWVEQWNFAGCEVARLDCIRFDPDPVAGKTTLSEGKWRTNYFKDVDVTQRISLFPTFDCLSGFVRR